MAVVLLTGATGFIGREVTRRLARAGHTVLALVRSLEKWERQLAAMTAEEQANSSAVRGDLREERLGLSELDYQRVLAADTIIHAGVPMDIALGEEAARKVILQGADHLLKLAGELHQRKRLQKLIHLVGYMSPFDDASATLATDVFAENKLFDHAGGYEKYKFLADLYVRQQAHQAGMPLVVVNPSTIIGPRHTGSTEQTDGLGLVVNSMRQGKFPVLPGGKEWWLPLLAVDDLAEVIVGIVEAKGIAHQTYYALNERGATPSFPELVQLIAKELRMKPPSVPFPLSVLKTIVRNGGSRLLGVPANSMDFIVKKQFPLAPFQQMKQTRGVGEYQADSHLPSVVADLDYRLSARGDAAPDAFRRAKVAGLAAYQKPGVEGAPWVLLHGLFSELGDLFPLAEQLGEEKVWLWDLPGFGRSPYHHREQKLGGFIEAVASALRELPAPVHLAGHSFGAFLAWEAAKRVPDKIAGVYLLQPPLHAPKQNPLLVQIGKSESLLQRFLQKQLTRPRLESTMIEQGMFRSVAEVPAGYLDKTKSLLQSPRISKTHAEVLRYFMHDFQQMEWGQAAAFPVHLVWGNQDSAYRLTSEQEIALGERQIAVHRHDLAHHFPLSHPHETASLLRSLRG